MPNITTFLDNNALIRDRPALIAPSRGIHTTYRELLDEVNRVALRLRDLGIGKGDRVCIYLDSIPPYLISYFAIWRIGAVAVPANIAFRGDELLHVLTDAGARGLIHGNDGARVVDQVSDTVPGLPVVLNIDQSLQEESGDAAVFRAENCRFDDLCQLQYTAGTTGRPKGAMLTHGNWIAALETEREVLSLTAEDRYLGIYPMGHVGVSWGLSVLRAGGTYVTMERFSLPEYLEWCRRFRITVLSGMPPVIHSLCSAPDGTEEDLASVRVMISGGGQLLPTIWEAFDRRYAIPVANAYGLSETVVVGTGTVTIPGIPDIRGNYRSVGVPVGYSEVKIVDPADPAVTLPPGTDGEVALRGPSVAQGYWGMPGPTAESFLPDGWFLTGDIGHQDAGGILYITDRKKDMIIMSGWKVYPTEVENVILSHPAVRDAAVFGHPDERRGEIPVAAVVREEGADLSEGELIAFCKERMAGYKVPRAVIIVDVLPRAHGWKLLRRKLREDYAGVIPGQTLS
ncbi:MAG: long-chain fatty acid--CoA ligase [Methanomicrobiales archaeon]|nr:long-chain fatty acid--CoA ligase [Methanomicrobiales archaeon]NYT21541.1 long-chain fatty acid--CoA ligase [Methanomicrobiales archaeon]